jgi:hypothetical protein
MNVTATKKIAFAALAAPALAAVAIGLAGAAAAEVPSIDSAQQTVDQLEDQGHHVIVNKTGEAPLDQCTVIATRHDRHEHHGGPQSDQYNTVYVDAFCPTVG